jgi:beta-glucosidase
MSDEPTRPFPPGFLWGAATSAFQVEGAVDEDGRGESIWDRFERQPGAIANGDSAAVTADHYHRWREDVDLLAELGLNAYRFSIAWPRVLPHGRGRPNAAGLAFYDRLVDALLEHEIAPLVTLYHWDLPADLEDEGGWLERSTVDAFVEYAALCFDALGDRVTTWFTINEPWVIAVLGYGAGIHAPGVRDFRSGLVAAHHLLLAHGRAVQAFRASGRPGRIGAALSLWPTYPASDAAVDRAAVVASDGYTNRWYLDPILRGAYPDDTRALFDSIAGPLDFVAPGDAATIGTRSDLLGFNSYPRRVVRAATGGRLPFAVVPASPSVPTDDRGWELVPDALTDLLVRLRDDYGDVPLVITENGAVFLASPRPDGRVADAGRTAFLRAHLAAAQGAIERGVRLEGYCHWSLLDNFEWAEGYRWRFGLVWVDYPSGARTIKDSGRAYARIARANGLVPEADEG